MLTVEEAGRAVVDRAETLPPAELPLDQTLGCTLATDIVADRDSPPFDKSVVDGFAVRLADLGDADRWLSVGAEITAGRTPTRPLRAGEAIPVMTGAPIPPGADAVVMIEKTTADGDRVRIDDPALIGGRNILPQGAELRAGTVVLERGERLTAARLGLLATVGRSRVAVIPEPSVAIIPTGDELVEPGQVPGPGQIRNSNAVMLRALAHANHARAEAFPIVADDPDRLRDALGRGLTFDVLLVTGGVSAGTRDLVPDTLEALGVERVFHKIKLKPGKPLWFGVGPRRGDRPGTLVFGLPGNPVSGLVGFLLFTRPALDILRGRAARAAESTEVRLSRPFVHSGDRPTYHPAKCHDGRAEPLRWSGSADLKTVAEADGFVVFPAGERSYAEGEVVGFLRLD
jgi:molybdopterin molybdotransferase